VRPLDHTHLPTRHLQGCRFIDSEADLDIAIKGLLPLSQAASLAYPEMVKSGTAETLVGLLSHENMDIVIDVVELVHELTDEDVGDEGLDDDENEDEDEENKEAPLKTLIEGLVSDPGLGCLSNSDSQTTSKPTLF
jgi:beta-catenin-like protein 1